MKICFPSRSRNNCIVIPSVIRKNPFTVTIGPGDGPIDRKYFEKINDHFSEIVKEKIISKDQLVDLSIMASIKNLSDLLTPAYSKLIQEKLKSITEEMNKVAEGFEVKI